ncbi:MAG: type I 3-dehydroquinate dehydratase [Lachnospiraceae bacterium]|nr:type I 3-dehydroquinate dehydratase [Lachnospiraceae bacterium]
MAGSITIKNTVIGKGTPCICVPLTGENLSKLMDEAEKAVAARPDLVEWRGDFFQKILNPKEVEQAFKELTSLLGSMPLIFTIRTKKEGGSLAISPEEYASVLEEAAAMEALSLMDVEILQLKDSLRQRVVQKIHQAGKYVIGSSHHFEKTPSKEEMTEILAAEDRAGADILKLAVMPQDYLDLARLLDVTGERARGGCAKPIITMSMGDLGCASRFCGEIFGSAVTFASVGNASAPGQLPLKELRELLRVFHKFL